MNKWKISTIRHTDEILLKSIDMRKIIPNREDIVHASTAIAEDVNALVTRNLKDFSYLKNTLMFLLQNGPSANLASTNVSIFTC